ncbi:MAG TPA: NAD(P)H-binding protein [Pseudonocardiaceae bacterium]|jgi:uncharacterized protein YbjT (DUF2867 family)|nr:NAD(P)H-binding protein [Pseudonocardiaceae bacterium]
MTANGTDRPAGNGAGRILVTGATGKVGRSLVTRLLERGAPVRAMVRDPETAALPAGVEVVRGDLTEPRSLPAALAGVDDVFLLWPLATADGAAEVVDVISGHAERLVYLSTMNVRPDSEEQAGSIVAFHAAIERLVRASGLRWTFLRPGGFAGNTLGWAEQIRATGVVRWPYAKAARSLIHEYDIAAVAALVLTDSGHDGAAYPLTGPSVLTQAEQVAAIGAAIGRDLRFLEVTPEAARAQLFPGWPAAALDGALSYWAGLVEEPEPVTDTVAELTGRPARTFQRWAREHADDFR